jgi:hypothetical protein
MPYPSTARACRQPRIGASSVIPALSAAAMVLFAIDRLAGRVLDRAAALPAAPRRHAASPS